MRLALRFALGGSTILALAFFSVALHCALRFLETRRAMAASTRGSSDPAAEARSEVRRPVFLSHRNLL
jgi:hypothetical protein